MYERVLHVCSAVVVLLLDCSNGLPGTNGSVAAIYTFLSCPSITSEKLLRLADLPLSVACAQIGTVMNVDRTS